MTKEIKTRPVTMVQVREYLAKAEEFLLAATSELEAERSIAATSLAIHAGINAADPFAVPASRREQQGRIIGRQSTCSARPEMMDLSSPRTYSASSR